MGVLSSSWWSSRVQQHTTASQSVYHSAAAPESRASHTPTPTAGESTSKEVNHCCMHYRIPRPRLELVPRPTNRIQATQLLGTPSTTPHDLIHPEGYDISLFRANADDHKHLRDLCLTIDWLSTTMLDSIALLASKVPTTANAVILVRLALLYTWWLPHRTHPLRPSERCPSASTDTLTW